MKCGTDVASAESIVKKERQCEWRKRNQPTFSILHHVAAEANNITNAEMLCPGCKNDIIAHLSDHH